MSSAKRTKMMPPAKNIPRRKTLVLSPAMWAEIEAYREAEQIVTRAEAIRRLLHQALRQEKARKRD